MEKESTKVVFYEHWTTILKSGLKNKSSLDVLYIDDVSTVSNLQSSSGIPDWEYSGKRIYTESDVRNHRLAG